MSRRAWAVSVAVAAVLAVAMWALFARVSLPARAPALATPATAPSVAPAAHGHRNLNLPSAPDPYRIPPPELPPPPLGVHRMVTADFPAAVLADAVRTLGLPPKRNGPFVVTSAWKIRSNMILAAGSFRLSGTPGLVVWRPRSQAVRMIALFMNGSPGPATIEGVNGNRVVIQQGLGYETYDEVTGAVGRADNKGDPTG